jgi:hypothetical protein
MPSGRTAGIATKSKTAQKVIESNGWKSVGPTPQREPFGTQTYGAPTQWSGRDRAGLVLPEQEELQPLHAAAKGVSEVDQPGGWSDREAIIRQLVATT